MLRINLLPPYIADGQKKKKVITGWTVGVIAVIALLLFRLASANADLAAAKAREETAKTNQTEYQNIDGQIKKENDKAAKTKEKQDFIADAQKYNNAWPAMLESVRNVTSNQILLKSLNIDAAQHKTINLSGFSQNEMNIVRWWMYLRSHKDRFETIFFNLPPHGFAGGTGVGTGLAGGVRGFSGGGPMMGGMPGGFQGQMPGSMGGGAMGRAGRMPGGMGMSSTGMGAMGMGGGRGFGGGGAAGDVGQGIVEGRQGINFTATLVLKDPMNGGVAAPAWPPVAAGGAAGGVGMGGMMGGMPGGMMGGMPGGMMGGMGGAAMSSTPPPAGAAKTGAAGGGLNIKGRSGKDAGDE